MLILRYYLFNPLLKQDPSLMCNLPSQDIINLRGPNIKNTVYIFKAVLQPVVFLTVLSIYKILSL